MLLVKMLGPLKVLKKTFLSKTLEYILLTYKGIEVFNFFGDIKKNLADFAHRITALEHKVEELFHSTKPAELTAPVVPPAPPVVVETKAPEQGATDAT